MEYTKIVGLEGMAEAARQMREQGKRVVLCHGTFDLMHTGHIRYLQRSRNEGDVLFVTVTGDAYVNKGPGRPVFNQNLRAESLAALQCVDLVAINPDYTAINPIRMIRPDVYAKGSEYRSHGDDVTGNIVLEINAVEEYGGEVIYTDEITFSSSSLLNEYFGVFTPEARLFLEDFRARHDAGQLHRLLDELAGLKVLVVGDAIIDQYHYVTPMGQTGKGNVMAVRYDSEEQFAGGAIAVANHVAAFASSVTLVTALGDRDSHEAFIREKLRGNVTPVFGRFQNAPTVTKRRFVDHDLAKLFEVYFFRDNPALEDEGRETHAWLEARVGEFDCVVVADFGNGFVDREMVRILSDKARFLAVNAQINSGNRGFHAINRYPRVDFASLNEPELRLAVHNRHDPLEEVAQVVAGKIQASHLAITRGTQGAVMLDCGRSVFHKVPALSTRVVDRIGAGDAFLSMASLCLARGYDADVALFLGSVAAAIDVQIVCNRDAIDAVGVKKYVTTLLK
ncbi:MAG: PfkB family carbohydrate kinase [Pseudomonadota bacterium]